MRPGKPNKLIQTLIFLLAVASAVTVLALLSMDPRPRPFIPDDDDHLMLTDWKACIPCHGKDGEFPPGPDHPLKEDLCFRCHFHESEMEGGQ